MSIGDFDPNRAFLPELDWTFGNRLELLAQALVERWRSSPELWLERRVVVPNRATGHWLQHYLASSLGICTGMRWWTPRSLAFELQRDQQVKNGPVLPTKEELHLALYTLIAEKLSSKKGRTDGLWLSLSSAFAPCTGASSFDERRLSQFCGLLTEIFERYGEFGAKAVRKWEKTGLAQAENWQAFLWRSLFGKGGPWCSLFSLCEHLTEELNFNSPSVRGRQELDIFALRHLSSPYWGLLRRISAKMPVRLFALSPCLHYWTDVRSIREQKRFLRWIADKGATASTLEAFESSLRQNHPLLANLGKVGRRFVEKSEFGNSPIRECYALPSDLISERRYSELWQQDIVKVAGKKTLLSQLQADLLFMRPFGEEDQVAGSDLDPWRPVCDGSIEVHCATSRSREIEIVKALIHQSLQCDESLLPSDFLLLAPDVKEYEALALSAFAQDEFGLQLRPLEGSSPQFGGFWQSMNSLLVAAERGFDAEEICKVLINPLIQKSIGLHFDETARLIRQIRESGVEWGVDQNHRMHHLANARGTAERTPQRGTWEEFHSSLLRGLAFKSSFSSHCQALFDPTVARCQQVEDRTSLFQMLEKWLSWFERFTNHLLLIATDQKKTMAQWAHHLMLAADALLPACPDQDHERLALFSWCRSWEKKGQDHPLLTRSVEKTPLNWSFVGDLLKGQMEEIGRERSYRQQGIRLAPLSSGAIPARVVIALGLSEGTLPRAQLRQPFELTAAEGMEYAPSSSDWDRCFFLEVLLAARDKLFLTYCTAERDDPAEMQEPSFLVGELLSTLGHMVGNRFMRHPKSIFELSDGEKKSICHFCHPHAIWNLGYFAANSPFHIFDQQLYRCALASQGAQFSPLGARLSGLYSDLNLREAPDHTEPYSLSLTLRQLAKSLAHPLEFFLQKRFGLSFWADRQDQRWLLGKQKLQKLQKLQLLNRFSDHSLCDNRSHLIAHANFQRFGDQSEWIAALIQGDRRGYELFLTRATDRLTRLDQQTWLMPAKVRTFGKIEVSIEGQFSDDQWLGTWGLALIDLEKEVKLTNFCRHWPHILAFCEAQPLLGAERHILIGRRRYWQPAPLEQESIWSALARFALMAYQSPLPLLPDWFDSYERADARELQERFYVDLTRQIPDIPQILQWIFGERVDSSLFEFWIESYHTKWRPSIEPAYRYLHHQAAHLHKNCRLFGN